jgi:hypothetical protein
MPMFKVNIDLRNTEKLKGIAMQTFGDDSEFSISLLLNRYLQGIN